MQEVFRENRASRVDAGLASALGAAVLFYEDHRNLATGIATDIAQDERFRQAVLDGDAGRIGDILAQRSVAPFVVGMLDPQGVPIAGASPGTPAYVARVPVSRQDGSPVGELVVGFVLDRSVAGRLSTGDYAVGFRDGDTLVTQDGALPVTLPVARGDEAFTTTAGGDGVRMLERPLADTSPPVSVAAVYPQARLDAATDDVRRKVAIAIGVVLVAILILAELLVRSITGVLGTFARRAREVGEGRFAGELKVQGNDEFATFARAFNQMAQELEERIAELEAERRRVQEAVGRFGQALESTHDVPALLGIVIESAMEAVGARGGRVLIVDEERNRLVENRRVGSALELADDVLPAEIAPGASVEGLAAQTGQPAFQAEPVAMLSVPLQTKQAVLGLLTLTDPRRGTFGAEDGATLQALAAQGAVAIENARMHRLITKQASTDGLTGLTNHREFQERLRSEVERAQRFSLPLALVLIDLDDFKLINDRFGHLAGDSVLRAVGKTLEGVIRGIDCAARYGGEEFAVLLPGTTAEGAARLAERVRVAIAERPATNADDHVVSVTASFGIAAMPAHGTTQVELIAAADEALYRAKDAGKNRIMLAQVAEPAP